MAVNADVPPIDVHFLDYPDKQMNDLARAASARSAWPGSPPPITAAVHHATGVRVRELPVKIEDLLTSG